MKKLTEFAKNPLDTMLLYKLLKRRKFKWQLITRYGRQTEEETTIRHYRLFKFFGCRLHSRPEIEAYEFRPAYFRILTFGCLQHKIYLAIPIPFIKYDVDIGIHNLEKKVYL